MTGVAMGDCIMAVGHAYPLVKCAFQGPNSFY